MLFPKRRQRHKRASKGFTPSANFRTVILNGKRYELTLNQALVVEQYFKDWQRNTPETPQTVVLEKLDIKSARLRDVFKKDPKTFKALFQPGKRRGAYRLKIR